MSAWWRCILFASDFAQFCPCDVQWFRQNASLGCGGHEIGITNPAWKHVQMDMSGDACAGGFAQIHAEIDSIWTVDAI